MNTLKEVLEQNIVDIQINSKEGIINFSKILMKFQVNIDFIAIYLDEKLNSIIDMIMNFLSSDKVSVSEY